jgi:predicted MPP superfamily phosphohydrolase
VIFLLLRLAAWAIFGLLPLLAAALAFVLSRRGRRGWAASAGATGVVVAAVGVDAFLIEPRALAETHVEIRSAALEEAVTIAILADIQTDGPGTWERSVFARVAEAEPDLIVFPGDYVQAYGSERDEARTELRRLLREAEWNPRLGAYAVGGNVEVGDASWPSLFEGTGVEVWAARRHSRDLGPVVLTGLPMRESFDEQIVVSEAEQGKFHVVFGHGPDFSLGEVAADLMIAGHTHGGQVRLPLVGPLLTFSKVPRSHASGHTLLPGDRHLVVSRGIGMERGRAPRMRFLCRPELVFVHLVPG